MSSLPGPAGVALRARKLEAIASRHLDVEHFTRLVLRGVWEHLPLEKQVLWTTTLAGLLRHRYVERLRDPREHSLRVLSTQVHCDAVHIGVALEHPRLPSTSALEFRLRPHEGQWRVYDVVLEGASLVNSWKTRLLRVYREDGLAGLDAQLRTLTRRYQVTRP